MGPFEVLYSRRCRSPVGWFESSEAKPRSTDFLRESLDRVRVIRDRLRATESKQRSYADRRHCPLRLRVGDRAFPIASIMLFVIF